ncbi:MAG: hypothetical protein ISR90_01815 [Candidatus Marinimicrobia bacterium]|nr:hypothetical protein [Candidatus Neomarinimicrobiota bacterium]MBL7022780.1 hypothetical protein [Candidatus Neomarinimicrobiota bacterium]MBL7109482.1 hypothetical protein [Candidatus Neomarinimicrobiota bacterium]
MDLLIDKLWNFIKGNEGNTFFTKTKKDFKYLVNGDRLVIIKHGKEIFTLRKTIVINAYAEYLVNKVEKPSQFSRSIMAPSYLWAMFNHYNPIIEKMGESLVATIFLSEKGLNCLNEIIKVYNNNISQFFNLFFVDEDKINNYIENVYDHSEDIEIKKTIRISTKARNTINQYSQTYGVSRNILIDYLIISIYKSDHKRIQNAKKKYSKLTVYLSKNIDSLTNTREFIKGNGANEDIFSSDFGRDINSKIKNMIRELESINEITESRINNYSNNKSNRNVLLSDNPIPDKIYKKIENLIEKHINKIPYHCHGIHINESLIKCTLEILNETEKNELPLNHRNATRFNTPDGLDKRIKIRLNSDLSTANIIVHELSKIGVIEDVLVENFNTHRLVKGAKLNNQWRW